MIEESPIDPTQRPSIINHPAWSWLDLSLMVFGIVIIFVIVISAAGYAIASRGGDITGELQQPTIWQSLGLAALEFIALIASVYFLGMRRRSIRWVDLGLIPVTRSWLLIVIGISVVVIPLSGLLTTLILMLLNLPLENPQLPTLIPEGLTWVGALAMLILTGLVVPIAEEIFFRGVVYNFLRARMWTWLAIAFSSLIFALAHGDFAVGTSAFIVGIAITWAYEKSGSLWTAILIHAANNSVKIILLYIFVLFKLIPS